MFCVPIWSAVRWAVYGATFCAKGSSFYRRTLRLCRRILLYPVHWDAHPPNDLVTSAEADVSYSLERR